MSESKSTVARRVVLSGRSAGAVYIACWFMSVALDHWGTRDTFTHLMIYRLLPLGAVLIGTVLLCRKASPAPFASLGIAGLLWTGCIVFYSLTADQTIYAHYGESGSPNFWFYMTVHMGRFLIPQMVLSALGIPIVRRIKAWTADGSIKIRLPRRVIWKGLAAGAVYALAWALSNHWFFHHSHGGFSGVVWYALAAAALSLPVLRCRDRREWGKGFCCAVFTAVFLCYLPFFFDSVSMLRYLFAWHPSSDIWGEFSAKGWDTVTLLCIGAPVLACAAELALGAVRRMIFPSNDQPSLFPDSMTPARRVVWKGLAVGAVYTILVLLIAKGEFCWIDLENMDRIYRFFSLCDILAVILCCLVLHLGGTKRWGVSLLIAVALEYLVFRAYTSLAYFAGDISDSPASGIGLYLVRKRFLRVALGTVAVMLPSAGIRAQISGRSDGGLSENGPAASPEYHNKESFL